MKNIYKYFALVATLLSVSCNEENIIVNDGPVVDEKPAAFSFSYTDPGTTVERLESVIEATIVNPENFIILTQEDMTPSVTDKDGAAVDCTGSIAYNTSSHAITILKGHPLSQASSPYTIAFDYSLLKSYSESQRIEGSIEVKVEVLALPSIPDALTYEPNEVDWFIEDQFTTKESAAPVVSILGAELLASNFNFTIADEYDALTIDPQSGIILINSDFSYPEEAEDVLHIAPTITVENLDSDERATFDEVISINIHKEGGVSITNILYESTSYCWDVTNTEALATFATNAPSIESTGGVLTDTEGITFELASCTDELSIDAATGVITPNADFAATETTSLKPSIRLMKDGAELATIYEAVTIILMLDVVEITYSPAEITWYASEMAAVEVISTKFRTSSPTITVNGETVKVLVDYTFDGADQDNPTTEADETQYIDIQSNGKVWGKAIPEENVVLKPRLILTKNGDSEWFKIIDDALTINILATPPPAAPGEKVEISVEFDPATFTWYTSDMAAAIQKSAKPSLISVTVDGEQLTDVSDYTIKGTNPCIDNPATEANESLYYLIKASGSLWSLAAAPLEESVTLKPILTIINANYPTWSMDVETNLELVISTETPPAEPEIFTLSYDPAIYTWKSDEDATTHVTSAATLLDAESVATTEGVSYELTSCTDELTIDATTGAITMNSAYEPTATATLKPSIKVMKDGAELSTYSDVVTITFEVIATTEPDIDPTPAPVIVTTYNETNTIEWSLASLTTTQKNPAPSVTVDGVEVTLDGSKSKPGCYYFDNIVTDNPETESLDDSKFCLCKNTGGIWSNLKSEYTVGMEIKPILTLRKVDDSEWAYPVSQLTIKIVE